MPSLQAVVCACDLITSAIQAVWLSVKGWWTFIKCTAKSHENLYGNSVIVVLTCEIQIFACICPQVVVLLLVNVGYIIIRPQKD